MASLVITIVRLTGGNQHRRRPAPPRPAGQPATAGNHEFGATLLSAGNAWGWILLPAAAAVLAFSVWVFTTAAKGWPVVEA